MYSAFEEGRMPRTHHSALLDHVRPAAKRTKLHRLCESLLAQFGTYTSKHFGWLRRVLTRKTDQLECRWRGTQGLRSDAAEAQPSVETVADSANAVDLGIAIGRNGTSTLTWRNMVCARREAGVVHLVKIHGLERGCALALTKKARRAALTYENGYACRMCGGAFEQRGLLAERTAQRTQGVSTAASGLPK
ncbi:hypothetical protein ERJ75_000490700 [Trypanosoma vivax]|nr:hypothetical protein ERJ75_000490700 [Trypanosoma vivax]